MFFRIAAGLLLYLAVSGFLTPGELRKSRSFFDEGIETLNKKEYKAAADSFRQSLAINPFQSDAHFYLGKTHIASGDRDSAVSEWNESIRINPEWLEPRLEIIKVYQKDNPSEALKYLNEAIRSFPGERQLLILSGELNFASGKTETALKVYQKLLETSPADVLLLRQAALCYQKLSDQESAVRTARKILEIDASDSIARQIIPEEKKIAMTEEAAIEIKTEIETPKINVDYSSLEGDNKWLQYLKHLLAIFSAGTILFLFRKKIAVILLKSSPSSEIFLNFADRVLDPPAISRELEKIYLSAGDYHRLVFLLKDVPDQKKSDRSELEKFVTYCSKAAENKMAEKGLLRLFSEYQEPFYGLRLGHVLVKNKKFREADGIYRRVLSRENSGEIVSFLEEQQKLYENDPQFRILIADIYSLCGDQKRACMAYDIAANQLPNDVEVLEHAADTASAVGKWKQALKHLSALRNQNPNNPEYYFRLAETCFHLGMFAETAGYLKTILEKFSIYQQEVIRRHENFYQEPEYRNSSRKLQERLAAVLNSEDDLKDREKVLCEIMENSPDDQSAPLELAEIYLEAGDHEKAAAVLCREQTRGFRDQAEEFFVKIIKTYGNRKAFMKLMDFFPENQAAAKLIKLLPYCFPEKKESEYFFLKASFWKKLGRQRREAFCIYKYVQSVSLTEAEQNWKTISSIKSSRDLSVLWNFTRICRQMQRKKDLQHAVLCMLRCETRNSRPLEYFSADMENWTGDREFYEKLSALAAEYPLNPNIQAAYGLLCQKEKENESAQKAYNRAFQVFRESSLICRMCGDFYISCGNIEKAEAFYKLASASPRPVSGVMDDSLLLSEKVTDKSIVEARALLEGRKINTVPVVFRNQRIEARTSRFYRKMFPDREKNTAFITIYLAGRYLKKSLYDECIKLLQPFLQQTDKSYRLEAGILLAEAFLARNFRDLARRRIDEMNLLIKDSGSSDRLKFHYRMGRLLEKFLQNENALWHYQEAASVNLDFQDLRTRLEKLSPSSSATVIIRRDVSEILGEEFSGVTRIGRGGMSEVFRASEKGTGQPVAIKVLLPEFINDHEIRKRFLAEAEASMRLQHPGIRKIQRVEQKQLVFLVMDYIEGNTMKDEISIRGFIPESESIQYAVDILEALDYAHKKGIIHRDVKPDNIILGRDGQISILDFGLARFEEEATRTTVGIVMGTRAYMSPEQIRGDQVDRQSDIYSFGCTLYEMLTGHPPFQSGDVAYQHLNMRPNPLRLMNREISAGMESAVLKCLEKDPYSRYQDIVSLLEDLNRIRG